MIPVKFKTKWGPFKVGQVELMERAWALRLIALGVAVRTDAPKPVPRKTKNKRYKKREKAVLINPAAE